MPPVPFSRRLALTAALTLTSFAAAAASAAAGCPPERASKPFLPWLDFADYVPVPEGNLENGGVAWTFEGGAGVVAGNEPYHVGGIADAASARVPAGGAAITAPVCVGIERPTLRLFARSEQLLSSLRVEVLFTGHSKRKRALVIGNVLGLAVWGPTPPLPMVINNMAAVRDGTMMVAVRFSSRDAGAWRIDDVYVDPYRTG